ncbi:MAG: 2-C-methyl-D-erythritol 4-phosphate cytidylyltransferase [Actinomycetota bacterium]
MRSAIALVPAAGAGRRLKSDIPKVLQPLAGTPVLLHVLKALDRCPAVEVTVVAVAATLVGRVEELVAGAKLARPVLVVRGGKTRQRSVAAALDAAPIGPDLVVVHDAARPLLTPALVQRVLDVLDRETAGALAALPATDTVKRVTAEWQVVETIPREQLWLAQTPQAFRRSALERAHRRAYEDGFEGTDDAALVERAGYAVRVVPGEEENLKITRPADLDLAEAILMRRRQRSRPRGVYL